MEVTDDDYGLFPELPVVTNKTSCAQCKHIVAIEFNKGNLFFCEAQKGGRYGKKIRKNALGCNQYVEADGLIRQYNGYYGNRMDGVKR
ncbi:hypothetical protein ACFSR7_12515 [Cohnella sp. GCM10020058]|uniref:hypothetical protein n=1 Tax=Cohnella sp. GCM10020058 TaxID=3317330 RepID=UPI0036311CF4